MKKNVAIVMSATSNLSFAIGNVLIGLERHSPGFADDVYIYHSGMDQQDTGTISKIRPCFFVEYDVSRLQTKPETEKIKQYSLLSFAVYEIFSLLDRYRHVVYLDCDLLIQQDIRGIIEYGSIAMSGGRLTIAEALGRELPGVAPNLFAKNTGVVIVNDQLPNSEQLTQQCYELTLELWDTLVFPDQAVLNAVMALNGIAIEELPQTYNRGKSQRSSWSAHIVHTQGSKSKFWNNGAACLMFPEWRRNNERWIALGGRPYVGSKYYWKLGALSQAELYDFVKAANSRAVLIPD